MRFFKVVLLCLVFLLVFILVWQNIRPILQQSITLSFSLEWLKANWHWETQPIPICLIIPFFFFVGMGIVGIVDIGAILRLRRRVRKLEKERASVSPLATKSTSRLSRETPSWDADKKEDTVP